MNRNKLTIVSFFAITLLAGFLPFSKAEAAWLTGWSNRRAITIDNTAGSALTDYQVGVDTTNAIYNETGLLGSWHLNESSGSIASDSSGNGYNGTVVGTTIVAGKYGNARNFDGSSYISAGSLGSFPTQGTLSFWVNASVMENYHNPLATKLDGSNVGIRFEENASGTFGGLTGNDAGTYTSFNYIPSGMQINTWYHIVYIWDTSRSWHEGYLNGTRVFSGTNTYWPSTISNFAIGTGFATTVDRRWKGMVDEVRIYNRALSASEVYSQYLGTKARLDYGDVRFADSDGSTLLNFWQESDKKSWVKVPSIPANTQDTIYMYYGKSDATSLSSISNTFIFGDDFNSGTIDSNKWLVSAGTASDVISASSGQLRSYQDGTVPVKSLQSAIAVNGDFIVDYSAKTVSIASGHNVNLGIMDSNQADGNGFWPFFTTSTFSLYKRAPGAWTLLQGSVGSYALNTFNNYKIILNGSNVGFYKDDIQVGGTQSITFGTNRYLILPRWWNEPTGDIADQYFDNIRVRKYAAIEPAVSVYGEQDNLTYSKRRAITIDNTSGSALYDYQVPVDLTTTTYNNTGLIGDWHFNEGQGSSAADSSGLNNSLALYNSPTWTVESGCKSGTCLSFNGSSQYGRLTTPAFQKSNGQELTVALWIKPGRLGGQYQDIIGNRSAAAGLNWLLYQHATDGSIQLHGAAQNKSSYIPSTTSWTYIVATVDSLGISKLYANSVLVQAISGYTYGAVTPNELTVGNFGTTEYYLGQIDEPRIYNRALSPAEISDLYNASKNRIDSNDIRFSDDASSYNDQTWNSSFSYWLESDKKAWVKVPYIPAATQKTIYMYYGNSSADSQSDISNTFLFGDDFDTGIISTDKWNKEGNIWTVNRSGAEIPTSGTAGVTFSVLRSKKFSIDNAIMESAITPLTVGGSYGKALICRSSDSNNMYVADLEAWSINSTELGKRVGGTWTNLSTLATNGGVTANVNYKILTKFVGTSLTNTVTNNITGAITTTSATDSSLTSGGVGLEVDRDETASAANFSYFFVRKYTATEPTTSVYSEQNNLTYAKRRAITVDNTSGSALYDYQVPVDLTTAFYNTQGLFSDYHFDEGAGPTIFDSSENRNHRGVQVGPLWVTGKYGNALYFNSSSVGLGNFDISGQGTPFSVFMWINTTQTGVAGDDSIMFSKRTGTNTFSFDLEGTSIRVSNWGSNAVIGTGTVNNGAWHQVGFTWNGTVVSIYIDGIVNAIGSVPLTTQSIANGNSLGAFDSGTTRPYVGSIDELRTYSRALSPLEIANLYNNSEISLNYSDLRFSDDASYNDQSWASSYSYWLESDKKAWVKVPYIPASTQKTIYMYYGNSSAPAQSDGNNTFQFFDDFVVPYISTNWALVAGSSIANGYLTTASTNDNPVFSTQLFPAVKVVDFDFYRADTGRNPQLVARGNDASNLVRFYRHTDADNNFVWQSRTGGTWSGETVVGTVPLATGVWHTASLAYTGTQDRLTINGVYSGGYTNSLFTGNSKMGFDSYASTGIFDRVRVRKYTATEPTTSLYAEQNKVSFTTKRAVTINNTSNSSTLYDYQVPVDITNTIYNNTNVVASWHLDEGQGLYAGDMSGNNNYGTLVNSPTWVATSSCKFGTCSQFNGGSQYITFATPPHTGTGSFTISAWIKTSTTGARQGIINYGGAATGQGLWLYVNTSNQLAFDLAGVAGPTSSVTVTNGAWHFVSAVYNGSSVQLYVDGSASGSSLAMSPNITGSTINAIGARPDILEWYFNGYIDEVKVFNAALSAADISNFYNASKAELNFDDLRFSDSSNLNDETWNFSYPYWIESDKKVWVKVPVIAGSANKTIYMYYGNSNATPGSDGPSTFIYWDDGSNRSGWTVSGAYQNITVGYIPPSYDTPFSSVNNYMFKNVGLKPNNIVEYNQRLASSGRAIGDFFFLVNNNGTGQAFNFDTNTGTGDHSNWYTTSSWNGWSVGSDTGFSPALNTWYKLKLTLTGTAAQININGTDYTPTFTFSNNGGNIGLISDGGTAHDSYWDNIRIRKYTVTEPTITIAALAVDCGMRAYDGTAVIAFACDTSEASPLQVAKSTAPTSGLVGYWKFDEGTGLSAADSSGNNNNGTLINGPTWTIAGKINGGLTFDGVDSYVSVPRTSSLTLNGKWTLAAWVYRNSATQSFVFAPRLVNQYYDDFSMPISPDGTLNVSEYYYPGYTWIGVNSVTKLGVGQWYHVVGTYDYSANYMALYINGALDNYINTSLLPVYQGNPIAIGSDPYSLSGRTLDGKLDEVRIYNRALSPSEITSLYSSGAPIYNIKLVDPSDSSASKFRVQTSGGTKAIMKYTP